MTAGLAVVLAAVVVPAGAASQEAYGPAASPETGEAPAQEAPSGLPPTLAALADRAL